MIKIYPLVPIASTGDVQGGRQRSPHMADGKLVPYLRVANVFDGYIDFSDVNEMLFKPREIDRFRLIKGDILLNEGQSVELVGRCAMFEDGPEDCCYQNTLVRYRAGAETDPHFALQLFRYCQHIGIFSKIAVKTNSIAHLGVSRFADLELPFPPHQVQIRIAEILKTWDTAIQKTEQLIAAKERHRDALIARLYALSDSRGRPSHFRELLEESTETGSSGRHAKKITVKLYGKGVLAKDEKRRGSEQTQYFVRRAGQLIYSKLDFLNGAFGIVPPELDGYESTLDLPAFDIAPTVNAFWLLGYLTRPAYYRRQVGLARGQRKARRVHPSDLLALSLRVPPRDLQDRIAGILSLSQCDIDESRRLLDLLKTQKRGLMQKLLTGQWRLPVAAAPSPPAPLPQAGEGRKSAATEVSSPLPLVGEGGRRPGEGPHD